MQITTAIKPIPHKYFRIYSILVCLLFVVPVILAGSYVRDHHNRIFHTLLFSAGWLLWTWTEYHAHRFFMHPSSDKRRSSTSRSHLHHHKSPSELEVRLPHRIALFIFSCLFFYLANQLNN